MSDARDVFDALDHALDPIWERVALHQRISHHLTKILPQALVRHLRVSCIEHDALILICDTPAWASDLRYREALIVESVNLHEQLALKNCRILVRPEVFNRR